MSTVVRPYYDADYGRFRFSWDSNGRNASGFEVAEQLAIPGTLTEDASSHIATQYFKVAAWNGLRFEAVAVWESFSGRTDLTASELERKRLTKQYPLAAELRVVGEHEAATPIYIHIDPRVREVDVVGATIAEVNAAGTGWLFGHCDADAMIDYEHELAAAAVGVFARLLDLAQVKVNEATNPAVKETAVANHYTLFEFREAVITKVLAWCRSLHIGWQQQNPHLAHVHLPILQAVLAVEQDWRANQPDRWRRVNARVTVIEKELSTHHAYETRWDKTARLAAEVAAAESEAEVEGE